MGGGRGEGVETLWVALKTVSYIIRPGWAKVLFHANEHNSLTAS
jgi:hypothetical protein